MHATPLVPGDRSAGGGPLHRAFTVLTALAAASLPLTLSELAEHLELPKSSVHRTLRILTDLRLAERTAAKGYTTGDAFESLVRRPAEATADGLSDLLTPYLLDLVAQTRQVASVATFDGTAVTHCSVLHDHEHAGVARAVRGAVPTRASAPAKLLVAATAGPTVRLSPALREELELVRRNGLAHARTGADLVEVAAPIHAGHRVPVAALVLTGPVHQLDLRRAGSLLLRATTGFDRRPETVRETG